MKKTICVRSAPMNATSIPSLGPENSWYVMNQTGRRTVYIYCFDVGWEMLESKWSGWNNLPSPSLHDSLGTDALLLLQPCYLVLHLYYLNPCGWQITHIFKTHTAGHACWADRPRWFFFTVLPFHRTWPCWIGKMRSRRRRPWPEMKAAHILTNWAKN